jgi:ribonucleoside-diphosphate reductase alpha chain
VRSVIDTHSVTEQPLPAYGACLLGSFNLVKYIKDVEGVAEFDFKQFEDDIPIIVRAMDNIHDNTIFPLPQQAEESKNKRRMGLGLTGVANAGEILGWTYGSPDFLKWLEKVLMKLRNHTYIASAYLAKEKGAFPLFNKKHYLQGEFIQSLPKTIQDMIGEWGIRNSHLLSIAPTGTISLTADNVSSGIEPVFSHYYDRTIRTFDGERVERVEDYAYRVHGVKGKTAGECTAEEHLAVLALSSKYVDSAVSKTINVLPTIPWEEFKNIYINAWKMGCKGCTTFNSGGKRFGILNAVKEEETEEEALACYIDPTTGKKTCE